MRLGITGRPQRLLWTVSGDHLWHQSMFAMENMNVTLTAAQRQRSIALPTSVGASVETARTLRASLAQMAPIILPIITARRKTLKKSAGFSPIMKEWNTFTIFNISGEKKRNQASKQRKTVTFKKILRQNIAIESPIIRGITTRPKVF